jgi:hypothetical protein
MIQQHEHFLVQRSLYVSLSEFTTLADKQTSTGKCLFINELSGDFRANLNLIQVGTCDGSTGQLWDIITKGKHDDQAGTMLVVNTLVCRHIDAHDQCLHL